MTQDRPLGVKLNLTKDGDDVILLTPGQLIKIERAITAGKKVLTIRMSRKQVQANVKVEGGFLGTLLSLASRAIPTLLGGLATGLISGGVERAIKGGNGLFLGKRGYGTAQIDFTEGNGLMWRLKNTMDCISSMMDRYLKERGYYWVQIPRSKTFLF